MMPRKIKRKDNLTKPIQPIANAPADFFVIKQDVNTFVITFNL